MKNGSLSPQLKSHEDIKKVLKRIEVSLPLADGRAVNTLLTYFPIEAGKSTHQQFLHLIKESLLYNFVFSCSEVEKRLNVRNEKAAEYLFKKAVRKISKATAHGELGELLLFTLLDVYIKAPKILSKISLKTNRRMPVYGADAVHGQMLGDEFVIYLGESKLHTKFNGAAMKAVKSIKNASSKYEEELDLIDSHLDFPGIDAELKERLMGFFDPFSEDDQQPKIHSPCFIGFANPEMIAGSKSEQEFIDNYLEVAKDHIGLFFEKAESEGINIDETSLFILPYSCVESMVDDFIEYVGVKK